MKVVSGRELCFYKILADESVTPLVKSYQKIGNDKYEVDFQPFGKNLIDLQMEEDVDPTKYRTEIGKKINKLHKLGIIHGDLHATSIFVDRRRTPLKDRVRLMDFEVAIHVDEFKNDLLKRFDFFMEPGEPFQNLAEVIDFEKTLYLRDL